MITFGPDIETTGKNPFEHKLITIQLRRKGETHVWKEWESNERSTILAFLEFYRGIPRSVKKGGDTFVAFNALHFDIPFIIVRAQKTGVTAREFWSEEWIYNNLVRWPVILDLYQLLGDKLMGYAKWRGCLVGTFAEYTNKQMPEFYARGEYQKIIQYVEDEMVSLEKTYSKVLQERFYHQLEELRSKAATVPDTLAAEA